MESKKPDTCEMCHRVEFENPTMEKWSWEGMEEGTHTSFYNIRTDEQYLNIFEIPLVHGRFFSSLGTNQKGIVINEPSWVTIDKRSRRPLAIGMAAKEMVGRTPKNVIAVRPLRDGVISEFDITQIMQKNISAYLDPENTPLKGEELSHYVGAVFNENPEVFQGYIDSLINLATYNRTQEGDLNTLKKDDCLIMSAAVSDYKVKKTALSKIKKSSKLTLELVENPDILKSIKKKGIKYKVGFALESEQLLNNAQKKLIQKNLDMIVANSVSKEKSPFGEGNKDFIVISKNKTPHFYENMSRKKIAIAILDTIEGNVL